MTGEDQKGQASKIIEHPNPIGLVQVYSAALGSLGKKPRVKLLAYTHCRQISDLLPYAKKQDLT